MKNRFNNNRGYLIIYAVVLIMAMGFLGTTVIDITSVDARTRSHEVQNIQALQLGNGGLQYALERLKNGFDTNNITKTLGNGEFEISTVPASSEVFVTAKVGDSAKTLKIRARFSKDCLEIDTSQIAAQNNFIEKIRFRKTCNSTAYLTHLSLNWQSGVANKITSIISNSVDTIYGPGGNGNPGEQLDVTDQTLSSGSWNRLDFEMAQPAATPDNFTVTLFFADGSSKVINFNL